MTEKQTYHDDIHNTLLFKTVDQDCHSYVFWAMRKQSTDAMASYADLLFGGLKDTMSLLQRTSKSVEICRTYVYVMYVLSVKFKR